MKLIIVESPTKAKTITKFLGSDYKVESSFGHIRDLPKSNMGIDIEHDFAPKYVIPTKSKKIVANLKKLAEKADKIILASDEDREGEAIAWHLIQALGLEKAPAEETTIKKTKTKTKTKAKKGAPIIERIAFHEITKEAILKALENPRELNLDLVDAQQARRILDRLVGYELSPFLWKKVTKGLSAGRVQSVAVRLVVEREREIKAFKVDEYWSIEALLNQPDKKKDEGLFLAVLNKINGKTIDKLHIKNKEEADKIVEEINKGDFVVSKIEKKQSKKTAPAPLTTSSLQITANRMLGFSAKQTMTLAQKLYETGHITYMRTDSVNLSDKFLGEAADYLKTNFGEKYSETRKFKTKSKGAQEAHEAIRPTEAANDPKSMEGKLDDSGQFKLYRLIWQRSVASQMPDALFDNTSVEIDVASTSYQFHSTGQILKFDGYLKIFPEKSEERELPDLKEKEELKLNELKGVQHFTKPPARYSDAGLVKILEQHGIGRPSTYAPTIATIIDRNYVTRDEGKRLAPNEIAFVVIDLLVAHFPHIVDYEFTSEMEKGFDDIAEGATKWQPFIKKFYDPFHENLLKKYEEIKKEDVLPDEKSTEVCDKCGSPMIIKHGRFGKFLGCSNFPECKNIKSLGNDGKINKEVDEKMKEYVEKYKDDKCEKCGLPMMVKNGRFGLFLSCSGYPKCKNIKNIQGANTSSTGIVCPACGKGDIVQKRSRRGIFYACSAYPDCKNAYWSKPTGEKCPDCGALLIAGKDDKVVCSKKECGYTK